jgi:hypothetical protein
VVIEPWTGFSFTGRIRIRFCERYIVQDRTETYIGLIAAFVEQLGSVTAMTLGYRATIVVLAIEIKYCVLD